MSSTERKAHEIQQRNITTLKKELTSKDEITKILIETQTSILEPVSFQNESNELVNQLQSAHQSPNKINCSKSPSSQHLLNGTSNYHQNVNTNASEANKNSCETNRIYLNTLEFNSRGHVYRKKSEQQRQRQYHK